MFSLPYTILEKLTRFHALRGVYLHYANRDWSALTKIRSLQTLTLHSSCSALTDCSPLLKSLGENLVDLQEWKRTGEDKFHLTKLRTSDKIDGKLILSEPHLQELDIPFFADLELPTDRLAPLRITIRAEDQSQRPSEIRLLVPFVHSLILDLDSSDLSCLALSHLQSIKVYHSTVESVSKALSQSKPKLLTSLELYNLTGQFDSLPLALLECPALTSLVIIENDFHEHDVLPLAQTLHRLPLTKLTVDLFTFSDEAIECLLSLTALQDLILGTLSPKQLQLVADALPSLSSLQSLTFDTHNYSRCQHESAHLSLFSALSSSRLRLLSLSHCYFRIATLEACLDKIPTTQLTQFRLSAVAYADGFDPSLHNGSYPRVKSADLQLDWHLRFPEAKDRFCIMNIMINV
jgi:hypothetical protein